MQYLANIQIWQREDGTTVLKVLVWPSYGTGQTGKVPTLKALVPTGPHTALTSREWLRAALEEFLQQ